MENVPLVLAIKGNSLDDGPGIRTVIFFKGCPLSCVWCQNPESKRAGEEISFDAKECIDCGTCRENCGRGALDKDNPFYIDREKCDLCFQCVATCPVGALAIVGKKMSITEIVDVVKKDLPFFLNSGGGVTLSGGEPTLHMPFLSTLIQELKGFGIHILLETCGFFSLSTFDREIYPHLDQIYFDLKIFDREAHRQYCGVSNDRILQNFAALQQRALDGNVPLLPRVPLIPGITATRANLEAIAHFLHQNGATKVALLEYNPLWLEKTAKLGLLPTFASAVWMSREEIQTCKSIFGEFEVF